MDGFHWERSGEPVWKRPVRMKEFVLVPIPERARGIVEFADGSVHSFTVRYDDKPDVHGNTRTVGERLRGTYEQNAAALLRYEQEYTKRQGE